MKKKTEEKPWEKLQIKDDFMFSKLMRNVNLCKTLLETVLSVEIERIEYPEEQKTIDMTVNGKGVRLDVHTRDEKKRVFNVEMQMENTGVLPKRSRYYQGMIDLNLIEKGMDYDKLTVSFVIFICTFDLFGEGKSQYWFENLCIDKPEIALHDEVIKVFLNSKGADESGDEDLKAFLKYVDGQTSENSFVTALEQEVVKIRKNEEWRCEYMTLLMRDRENREIGREEGREEGIAAFIQDNIEEDIPAERILLKLQKRFLIDAPMAKAFYEKYKTI